MKTVKINKIISIKPVGENNTIDLEVDHPDHNFYCNGIVVSNSHSVSYASLAAVTAYLKFNHPQEFFLALLRMSSHEQNPREIVHSISQELRQFDIRLLPPDLVKSKMDFSIEGKNIRFGLTHIKGISSKTIENLEKFRESENINKFQAFLAAESAGLNIAALSALIQAGALSSYGEDRPRMVLEAQAFNILTEREKRFALLYAEKYQYDILNIIKAFKDGEEKDDKGKPVISAKRWQTFLRDYTPYRKIYDQNSKFSKFAAWYYEDKLLGYSYSYYLRDVFKEEFGVLNTSIEISRSMEDREQVRYVGKVTDFIKRKSKNGNDYLKVLVSDEYGEIWGMLCNSARFKKYDQYFERGGKVPDKDSIVYMEGSKSDDNCIFIDKLQILNEKIYMKVGELTRDEKNN